MTQTDWSAKPGGAAIANTGASTGGIAPAVLDGHLRRVFIPAHLRLNWFESGTSFISVVTDNYRDFPLDQVYQRLSATMSGDTWAPNVAATPPKPQETKKKQHQAWQPLMLTTMQSGHSNKTDSKSKDCWFACTLPNGVWLETIEFAIRKCEFSPDLTAFLLQAPWPKSAAHGLLWLSSFTIEGSGFAMAFEPDDPDAHFRTQVAKWQLKDPVLVDQNIPLLLQIAGAMGTMDGIAKIGLLGVRLTYRVV